MTRAGSGAVGVLILVLVRSSAAQESRDDPHPPAEKYQELLRDFQRAGGASAAMSDEERLEFVGRVFRQRSAIAREFVKLAVEHPDDPIAVKALVQAVWQVNTTPWPVGLVGRDDARAGALRLLERDHMRSEELGSVCQRLSWGYCAEYEPFLRAVLEKSPHRDVRGHACLSLARFLTNRARRLDLIETQPALGREFSDLFGASYLARLQEQDRARATGEAEVLLEKAADEYGDVRFAGFGTIGSKAGAELFELRHLVVGRSAPEIEGRDQDGRPFKLGDYRGKVTLLYFWNQY